MPINVQNGQGKIDLYKILYSSLLALGFNPFMFEQKEKFVINEASRSILEWGIFKRKSGSSSTDTGDSLNPLKKLKVFKSTTRQVCKSTAPQYCLACGETMCRADRSTIKRHLQHKHKDDKNFKKSNIVDPDCELAINDKIKRGQSVKKSSSKSTLPYTSSLRNTVSSLQEIGEKTGDDAMRKKSFSSTVNSASPELLDISDTIISEPSRTIDQPLTPGPSVQSHLPTYSISSEIIDTTVSKSNKPTCATSDPPQLMDISPSIESLPKEIRESSVSPCPSVHHTDYTFSSEAVDHSLNESTIVLDSLQEPATLSTRLSSGSKSNRPSTISHQEIGKFFTRDIQLNLESTAVQDILETNDHQDADQNWRVQMQKDIVEIKNNVDLLLNQTKSNKNVPADRAEDSPMGNFDMEAIKNCCTLDGLLEIYHSLKLYSQEDGAVLSCTVCYQAKHTSPEDLISLDTLEKNISPETLKIGNKDSLIYGMLLSKEKLQFLNCPSSRTTEEKSSWYKFKNKITQHFSCSDKGKPHLYSLSFLKQKVNKGQRSLFATSCIINATLTVTKMKAAALHLETLLASYKACGVDIGELGHGRKQYSECLKACMAFIRKKTMTYMLTRLPSTGLCPHFSTACDKSTINRTTNHGMMILIQYNGIRRAIPFGAPRVYSKISGSVEGGTSEDLANQLFDTLLEITGIPDKHLSYHMANHSDGQYQSIGFINVLKQRTGANLNSLHEKFHVVPWDNSHWLDLAIKDLQKANRFDSSIIFKSFCERVNKVAHIFHRGRGRDEYMAYCELHDIKSYEVNSYSTTRFFSSNFKDFLHMYCSYPGIAGAYKENRETDDLCEATKYEIRGRDFAIMICGIIDIFSPIEKVMTKSQNLNQQLWKVVSWVPKVIEILETFESHLEDVTSLTSLNGKYFPTLAKHSNEISVDNKFHDQELLEGWLIKNITPSSDGPRKKKEVIEWISKTDEEVVADLRLLVTDLKKSLQTRYDNSVPEVAHILHKCFEVQDIVALCCGHKERAGLRPKLKNQRKYLTYGLKDVKEFFEYVVTLPHVMELQENENLELCAEAYMTVYPRFKEFIHRVIWEHKPDLLKEWFPSLQIKDSSTRVTSLEVLEETLAIELSFKFHFSDDTCSISKLDEQNLFKSFYSDEAQILRKINQKVGDFLLHFLFVVINPHHASKVFRDCWPIYDKKRESQFRTISFEWLKQLSQNEEFNLKPTLIVSKAAVTPTNQRFFRTLQTLIRIALHISIARKDTSCAILNLPTLAVTPQQRVIAMKIIKSSKIYHSGQFISRNRERLKYFKLLREKSKELVETYHSLLFQRTEAKNSIQKIIINSLFVNKKIKDKYGYDNFLLGQQFFNEFETSIKSKNEELSQLWSRLENLKKKDENSWPTISALISGDAGHTCIDGSSYKVSVSLSMTDPVITKLKMQPLFINEELDLIALFKLSQNSLQMMLNHSKQVHTGLVIDDTVETLRQKKCADSFLKNLNEIALQTSKLYPQLLLSADEAREKLQKYNQLFSTMNLGILELCPPTPPINLNSNSSAMKSSELETPYKLLHLTPAATKLQKILPRKLCNEGSSPNLNQLLLKRNHLNCISAIISPNYDSKNTSVNNTQTSGELDGTPSKNILSSIHYLSQDSGCILTSGNFTSSLAQSLEKIDITPKNLLSKKNCDISSSILDGDSRELENYIFSPISSSSTSNKSKIDMYDKSANGSYYAVTPVDPKFSIEAYSLLSNNKTPVIISSSVVAPLSQSNPKSVKSKPSSKIFLNQGDSPKIKYHVSKNSPIVTKLLNELEFGDLSLSNISQTSPIPNLAQFTATEEGSSGEINKFEGFVEWQNRKTKLKQYTKFLEPSFSNILSAVHPDSNEIDLSNSVNKSNSNILENYSMCMSSLESMLGADTNYDFNTDSLSAKGCMDIKLDSHEMAFHSSEKFFDATSLEVQHSLSDPMQRLLHSNHLPRDSLFQTVTESILHGELDTCAVLNEEIMEDIRRESISIPRRESILSLGQRSNGQSPRLSSAFELKHRYSVTNILDESDSCLHSISMED